MGELTSPSVLLRGAAAEPDPSEELETAQASDAVVDDSNISEGPPPSGEIEVRGAIKTWSRQCLGINRHPSRMG